MHIATICIDSKYFMSGFRASRLGRLSWTMFDWANQPFYTLIMTFVFAVYFTDVFITGADGAQKFTLTQTISGIAIAILSPILGSISDLRGNRKKMDGSMVTFVCNWNGFTLVCIPRCTKWNLVSNVWSYLSLNGSRLWGSI